MIYVTRRERFSAAHKLYQPKWSKEQNEAVFGKCANENWHGHNFELFVTVKGEVDEETGFVADLKDLSKVIKTYAIELLDHRNINLDVPFMAGKMASTENLAKGIWQQIEEPLAALGCQLHSVRLAETENNSVEYLGES
ncbi:MAG: 6-pyruvoyl tetrahydropterin synthase family protein [Salibacteraceae bacterium]